MLGHHLIAKVSLLLHSIHVADLYALEHASDIIHNCFLFKMDLDSGLDGVYVFISCFRSCICIELVLHTRITYAIASGGTVLSHEPGFSGTKW